MLNYPSGLFQQFCIANDLSGSMSSAIILSAASANFFWSAAGVTGVALEVELEVEVGLELKVEGKDGLAEDDSAQSGDIRVGWTLVLLFTIGSCTCGLSPVAWRGATAV